MKYESNTEHERGSYIVYIGLNFSGTHNYHVDFYRYRFNKFGGTNWGKSYLVESITPSSFQRLLRVLSAVPKDSIIIKKGHVTYHYPCDEYQNAGVA